MSVAHPDATDSGPSTGLAPNLSSNNPFRNRATSPGFASGPTSPLDPPPRPVSRNPFLDTADIFQNPSLESADKMVDAGAAPRPGLTGAAAELFDNLTLNDKPTSSRNGARSPPTQPSTGNRPPPPYSTGLPKRGENVPPRGPSGHRPSRSQEAAMRARRAAGQSSGKPRPSEELDIFADPTDGSPQKGEPRRVRRNSESSVADRGSKALDPEEEKRRERRRRERRHREHSKVKRPDRKLDVIDKLDLTGIYGTGLFHHDGPFDACNPHRNRQGSRRAPMQAFPKDSLNNVLGGGGPINKRPDHATFLGNNDDEAFKDYSGGRGRYDSYGRDDLRAASKAEAIIQSATTRVEPIHGEETPGLGTSTFLEGAPASRTAMQRRESEQTTVAEGGLSRKKSLAQKIRGINNNRRDFGSSGRITSPEGVYSPTSPESTVFSPGGGRVTEPNPFATEFSKSDDSKKTDGITIVEPERSGQTSPRRGFGGSLERRATSDGSSGGDQSARPSGGFLSRVKSLKTGPRKPRPERPDKQMPQQQLQVQES